jgi:hypothetical protein
LLQFPEVFHFSLISVDRYLHSFFLTRLFWLGEGDSNFVWVYLAIYSVYPGTSKNTKLRQCSVHGFRMEFKKYWSITENIVHIPWFWGLLSATCKNRPIKQLYVKLYNHCRTSRNGQNSFQYIDIYCSFFDYLYPD